MTNALPSTFQIHAMLCLFSLHIVQKRYLNPQTNQITQNEVTLSYFPEHCVIPFHHVDAIIWHTVLCVVSTISRISHHAMLVVQM